MSHKLPDMRGRPATTAAVSVVVPPMSMTRALVKPVKAAAPLREFTGPLLKVRMGCCCACAEVMRVPSSPGIIWHSLHQHTHAHARYEPTVSDACDRLPRKVSEVLKNCLDWFRVSSATKLPQTQLFQLLLVPPTQDRACADSVPCLLCIHSGRQFCTLIPAATPPERYSGTPLSPSMVSSAAR